MAGQTILGLGDEGFCELCGSSYAGSAWNLRYQQGGNSGSGSYGRLGMHKADVVDQFIRENDIKSVIDFGCGDGNQILLMKNLPARYIGLDVSPVAISRCQVLFKDSDWSFYLYDPLSFIDEVRLFDAELTLSLDVLYHLLEDRIFENYLDHLFSAASRYVVIYSSDFSTDRGLYEQRRGFSHRVEHRFPHWQLVQKMDNAYPYDEANPDNTSYSDWYVYGRKR